MEINFTEPLCPLCNFPFPEPHFCDQGCRAATRRPFYSTFKLNDQIMAKMGKGLFGGFSGKIGNVVGYNRGGEQFRVDAVTPGSVEAPTDKPLDEPGINNRLGANKKATKAKKSNKNQKKSI